MSSAENNEEIQFPIIYLVPGKIKMMLRQLMSSTDWIVDTAVLSTQQCQLCKLRDTPVLYLVFHIYRGLCTIYCQFMMACMLLFVVVLTLTL